MGVNDIHRFWHPGGQQISEKDKQVPKTAPFSTTSSTSSASKTASSRRVKGGGHNRIFTGLDDSSLDLKSLNGTAKTQIILSGLNLCRIDSFIDS